MLKQKSESCWMFSVLNALLLGKYSRRVILKHMNTFLTKLSKDKKGLFLGGENNIKSKKWYFFRYARTFWREQRQLNNSNQNVYKRITNNPIGCKFARGVSSPSYVIQEQKIILSSIGITDQEVMIIQKNPPSTSTGTRSGARSVTGTVNAFLPHNIPSNHEGFKLNSAILYVFNNQTKNGHVITGIIAPDGSKKVIDSNGHIIDEDWTTKEGLHKTENFYKNKYEEIYISSIMYINDNKLPPFKNV